jgi:hypothetical protein
MCPGWIDKTINSPRIEARDKSRLPAESNKVSFTLARLPGIERADYLLCQPDGRFA